MEKHQQKLTALEFFEKLQNDQLEDEKSISITGMVKKSENGNKSIDFAPNGNCENWISISIEFIKDVIILDSIACKDHSHPLVTLNISNPQSEEGKMFLAFLEKSSKFQTENQENKFFSGSMNMPSDESYNIPAVMSRTAGRRFGGGFNMGFGSTLPKCAPEKHQVPCGSALPGYPTPMCDEYWYCCTWPNGTKSCM